ncbi:hypothetical protein [Nocardioides szechwanensis]|nr:hypothetical protein [Nocardioides szechwanensis]
MAGSPDPMNLKPLLDQPFLDQSFPLPVDEPFTTAMAYAEGVTRANLVRLVDLGFLRRPIRNVYVSTQLGDSPLLRAKCLALVVPPDCVVCDRHAGWLLGAEMILAPNEHLDLSAISMFRPSDHGRLRNPLADSGERNLVPSDIMEVAGLLVTTPLRTAWDLGRVRSRERTLAALDAMLRTRLFTHEELLDGVTRFRGMRWVRNLRALAPMADGAAASPGESILRLRWLDRGLPRPQLQVEVWVDGVLAALLDIAHEDLRFAAEYDGAEWHGSPAQQEHDRRRRELVREQGWVVTPFVASDVFGRERRCDQMLLDGVRQARTLRGSLIDSASRL